MSLSCSRQGSKHFFFFSHSSWAANTLSGFLNLLDFASRYVILTSRMQSTPQIKTSPLSPLRSLQKRHLTINSCCPLGDSLSLAGHIKLLEVAVIMENVQRAYILSVKSLIYSKKDMGNDHMPAGPALVSPTNGEGRVFSSIMEN
jgi:hypothetical protein